MKTKTKDARDTGIVRLYCAQRDIHREDRIIIHAFNAKKRKDGGFTAEGMLSFLGYRTILQPHHLRDLALTPEEAYLKLRQRAADDVSRAETKLRRAQEELQRIVDTPNPPVVDYLKER